MKLLIIDRHYDINDRDSRYEKMAKVWRENDVETYVLTNSFSPLREEIPVEKGLTVVHGDNTNNIVMKNKPYSFTDKTFIRFFNLSKLRMMWMAKTGFFKPFDVVIVSSTMPSDISCIEKFTKKNKKVLIYDMEQIWPLTLIEKYGRSSSEKWMKRMYAGEHDAYCFTHMIISTLPYTDRHLIAKEYHPTEGEYYTFLPEGVDIPQVDEFNCPNMEVVKNFISQSEKGKKNILAVVHEDTKDEIFPLMNLMRDNKDKAALSVLCEPEDTEKYIQYAESIGISDSFFVGEKGGEETWVSTMKIADFVYYSAEHNGMDRFGYIKRPILLSMCTGRPILYRVFASNNLVKQAVCGRYTETLEESELELALKFMVECSDAALDSLGANGRTYIEKMHDINKLAQRYYDIFAKPYKDVTYSYHNIIGGKKVTVGE